MKFLIKLIVLFLVTNQITAQNFSFFFGQNPDVIIDGKNLQNAWAGGLNSAQVSTLDVNFDDLPDLVIFDRTSYKITVFIQQNKQWKHAPEYEAFFPILEHWLLLKDYDGDGKKDLFTMTSFGITLYKNTSNNGILSWEIIANPLKSLSLSELRLNMKVDVTDIPAIVDIDNDGDLDIFNFVPFTGESIEFHKNLSVEKYGVLDSLEFEKVESRFGNFSECSDCNQFAFNQENCSNGRIEHAGSSLLIFDTNGDENLDFIIGDVSCTNLMNLVTSGNTLSDSITQFITHFPPEKPVDLPIFPASYYEDVTFDGIPDLLVSPNLYANENNSVNFKKSLWVYQNNPKNNIPNFEFIQDNFLQNEMLDFGESAQPIFADEDGDGDLDMFVCNAGEITENGNYFAQIYLFENIQNTDNPIFNLKNENYLNLSSLNLTFLKIAFFDLNQDEKLDFIYSGFDSENRNTEFNYILNEADNKLNFNLQKVQKLEVPIRVGESPLFWDIDGDLDADLLVGKYAGNLEYYENQGNLTFELQTDSAGGISENFYQQVLTPVLMDLEADGKPELMTLDRSGILQLYPDFTEHIFDKIIPQKQLIYNKLDKKNYNFHFGKNTSLGVYNHQNLAVGMGAGGVLFLEKMENGTTPTAIENHSENGFKVFPNPANNQLRIESKNTKGKIVLFNVLGKTILKQNIDKNQIDLDIPNLKNGVYFLKFITENNQIITKKIVVFHQN